MSGKSALIVQCCIRKWLSKVKFREKLSERYEKIYDPKRKKYFYYDSLLARSSWKKPRLLKRVGGDLNVAPTYTDIQAAILVQRNFRRYKSRRRFLRLYVKVFFYIFCSFC